MSQIFQKAPQNYQYYVGISNAIDYEITPVTLNGVVADTNMQDLIIPARTFVQDGQVIKATSLFTSAVITNSVVKIRLNGTEIVSSTRTNAGSSAFTYETQLIRQGTTLIAVTYIFADMAQVSTVPAGAFGGASVKLVSFDYTAQIALVYSASVPNGGQSLTQECCYCSIQ